MVSLSIDPSVVADAAGGIGRIGDMITDANVFARGAATAILPAGTDEVSAMITTVFNGHGHAWQALAAQSAQFHQHFVQTLTQAANAYEQTEQAAGQALRNEITQLEQLVVPAAPPTNITPITVPTNSSVGLILGGTDEPFTPSLLGPVQSLYNLPATSSLVYTPEQFWPLTPQLGGLTLGQSVQQGTVLLNQAINTELAAGNHVTVWGTSQSSTILTDEIRNLMATGSPDTNKLSFILTGDPNNPNGGIFERFAGHLPSVLSGATPPNSPYPTAIYDNQYDAIGDFPQNSLNVVSDANAIIGTFTGRHYFEGTGLGYTYYQLPTSPGYTGNTTYYMALDNTLPLVQPLRDFGGTYGNAFADLLQPDLRVICDLGYDNGYANIPTPAQLIAVPNIPVVAHDLTTGAVQGVHAFGVDLGLLPHSDFPNAYPYLPSPDADLHIST